MGTTCHDEAERAMRDVTELILDDHAEMRRQFADLDNATTDEQLAGIWASLSILLDLHAATEEAVFYPHLLHYGAQAGEETDDAVRDHNAIRDAVAAARRSPVGSEQWWAAVGKARQENDEHLAEEERKALPDFRRHATDELRHELAARFLAFKAGHPGGQGANTGDKDPAKYIEENR